MNINIAICLFFIIALIYLVCAEIFTVMLRLSGVPIKKAHFQAVSLLTNTGFTTEESEIIVSDRRRRRLAQIIILFGYIFSISVVSIIVNLIMTIPGARLSQIEISTCVLFGIFVLILVLSNIRPLKIRWQLLLEKWAIKQLLKGKENSFRAITHIEGDTVFEIYFNAVPDSAKDKTLGDIEKEYDLQPLALKRSGKMIIRPDNTEMLKEKDILIVIGLKLNICRAFFKETIQELIDDALSVTD